METPNWVLKPASAQAKKQWLRATAQELELMSAEKERLENDPLERGDNPRRTHKLRGSLGQRNIGGVSFEQWQHELSSSGRIWYCVDRQNRIVWITYVSLSHPKETE